MGRQTVSKAIKNFLPKKCYNCGATQHLVYHHIVPVECGGNDTFLNIAVLCAECHGKVHYGNVGVICHGDLVKDGIAKARAEGRKNGRKPADYNRIIELIAKYSTQSNSVDDANYELHTEAEIMEMAGVKPVCYAKCKNMLKEAMDAPEWRYDWDKPTIQKKMPLYDHFIKKIRTDERKLNMRNLSAADKKRIIGDTVNG